jgi:phosphoglycerol transferase MdoB-like AlkP superfamily enzyme
MIDLSSKRFPGASPLGTLTAFAAFLLALFSFSRLLLFGLYSSRLLSVKGVLWCFPVGLRMDLIVVCYVLFLPVLAVLLLPPSWLKRSSGWVATYCAAWATATVYMEVATFPFVAQYDTRPNRLFFEYLNHPKEVLGLLLAEYKLALVLSAVLSIGAFFLVQRWIRGRLQQAPPWSTSRRLMVLPLMIVGLFLGARSSLRHRGANISTAAFSSDHLANQCALNSVYSLAYAVYSLRHEADPGKSYGRIPRQEVFRRVKKYTQAAPEDYLDPALPLLHRQHPRIPRSRPLNLVIFLQESLGAEYVSCLGGLPLTPELCELAEEGTLFTNFYATGTRTVRGMEAVISGFLPTPGRSVVKLGLSQQGFFTLGQLLLQHGYATEFLYGGESHFDNMRSFLLGNGFQAVGDETEFKNPSFQGTWGVSDEDLAREANASFKAKGDKPFLGFMLSTSNHSPFEFPEGKIKLYEKPQATVHNAMKYADFSIGEFFRAARQEAYFKNTLFLVVADHNTRVYGDDLVPIKKFRIPALLLGPGVPKGKRVDTLASQIDLIPTIVGLLGLKLEHPVPGRDLLDPGKSPPPRAVMQFGQTHAFRTGDQVVVHQPKQKALQFTYQEGRLIPTALNEELRRDALAHALLPGILYREGLHHGSNP